MLIDGNNILFRAVEATRKTAMNSADGTSTSGLVVTVKTIARYIRQYQPYRVSVLWDPPGGPNWRKFLYPEYKANRPSAPDGYRTDTRVLVSTFLQHAGVHQMSVPGQEADDLIAAHWRREPGEIVIVSNDKDLLQLVGPTPLGGVCHQVRVSSADTPTDYWTPEHVESHYGCTPAQLPYVLALAGDASDNIPGVPKIGPKFAVKHMAAAGWDLDAVEHQGIKDHREQVDLYLQLVDLRSPSPCQIMQILPGIPAFRPTVPGPDAAWRTFWDFLDSFQLRQFQRQLFDGELWEGTFLPSTSTGS
jgi:5'-3' exonuclease